MHRSLWIALIITGLTAAGARADLPAVPPAAASVLPAPRVLEETAPLTLTDSGKARVTLRVPVALHRGANAFRLYGVRPLTLWSRDRRRDLYRDAFLELATRARLTPSVSAWDTLSKQWDWIKIGSPGLRSVGQKAAAGTADGSSPASSPFPASPDELLRAADALARQVETIPGYRHLGALGRALGGDLVVDAAQPITAALELRALATDEAERRLQFLGRALDVEGSGKDPALRDGYRAAQAEFDEVRQGLWPAVAASLRKNQGRLLMTAARDLALSHLGFWAIFGYLGWQGAEGVLNAEYAGQYSVCLATLAAALAQSAGKDPDPLPLALYAEYLLNYQLTEALKEGQVMELKPAGGRDSASWQIRFTGRCEEIRKALSPG
jgi:hypothetical protein